MREFYARSSDEISCQACAIIDQLLAAPASSAHAPAAHLFRQVAQRVALPSGHLTPAPNNNRELLGRGVISPSPTPAGGGEPAELPEDETFDSTASRHALATLAALEFPQSLSG